MHNFINRCYGSGGACLFSFPEITRRFLNNAELLEIAGHGGRPWGSKFGRHVPTISRISARSGKQGGGDGGFAGEVAGSDANSSKRRKLGKVLFLVAPLTHILALSSSGSRLSNI
jgi:hypothetical protein